jgi:hypothetical protein
MRVDMGIWGDGAEESMEVVSRNKLLKNLNGLRDLLTVFFKLNVMKEKIEDVPITFICTQGTNFIWCCIFRSIPRAPIGLETMFLS